MSAYAAVEQTFGAEDKATLRKLLAIIEAFRTIHPEAKARWLSEVLQVALEEGESIRTYARRLNVNYNVASIDYLGLGQMLRNREPGLDLLVATPNRDDLRKHEVRLSAKGRSLLTKMLKHMKTTAI